MSFCVFCFVLHLPYRIGMEYQSIHEPNTFARQRNWISRSYLTNVICNLLPFYNIIAAHSIVSLRWKMWFFFVRVETGINLIRKMYEDNWSKNVLKIKNYCPYLKIYIPRILAVLQYDQTHQQWLFVFLQWKIIWYKITFVHLNWIGSSLMSLKFKLRKLYFIRQIN